MSPNSEYPFIENCKEAIEKILEWKHNKEWRNSDFEQLSDQIFEKTKTNISVSTLKRIWKNPTNRSPHISTLNALAKFLDYENWYAYKSEIGKEYAENNKNLEGKKNISKKDWITLFVILGVMLIGVVVSDFRSIRLVRQNDSTLLKIDGDSVLFTSKKTVSSGLPNSVIFQYDISEITFDSAFIQQDWDIRKRAPVLAEDNYHTSIYYYPGHYTAKLVVNNTVVKTHPLFITSDGWMPVQMKKPFQEVPVYLKNIDPVKNGRLFVSVEDLALNKIENDKDYIYWVLQLSGFW